MMSEWPHYGDLVEDPDGGYLRITDPDADGSSPPLDWEHLPCVGGCSLGEPWESAWGPAYT